MLLSSLSVQPLAPLWFIAPMALLTMAIIVIHLAGLSRSSMPASRRRIRFANGVLMFFMLPLGVYALAIVPPIDGRRFVFCWMLLAALVVVVLLLAWLDIANNIRLASMERKKLSREAAMKFPRPADADSGTRATTSE